MAQTGTAVHNRGGRRGGDADTRGDILRAARALFGAGYDATSVRHIADRMNIAQQCLGDIGAI